MMNFEHHYSIYTIRLKKSSLSIANNKPAYIRAKTNSATAHADTVGEEDEPTPLGVYTKITLGMDSIYQGDIVYAQAYNKLTIGFSQVYPSAVT